MDNIQKKQIKELERLIKNTPLSFRGGKSKIKNYQNEIYRIINGGSFYLSPRIVKEERIRINKLKSKKAKKRAKEKLKQYIPMKPRRKKLKFKNPFYKQYIKVTNIKIGDREILTIGKDWKTLNYLDNMKIIKEILEDLRGQQYVNYGGYEFDIENFEIELLEVE